MTRNRDSLSPGHSGATMPVMHTSLFLRADATLMVVRDGQAIEMALSAEQLLQLGVDALRVAVALDPNCLAAATLALAQTMVLPDEASPCKNAH